MADEFLIVGLKTMKIKEENFVRLAAAKSMPP